MRWAIRLTMDDFSAAAGRVPHLVLLSPRRRLAEDLHEAGGIPALGRTPPPRPPPRRVPHRHRADGGRERRRPRGGPARGDPPRQEPPLPARRPGLSCAAAWPPRAPWSRAAAVAEEMLVHAGRASTTARKTPWRPSLGPGAPRRRGGDPLRGPKGGPGMREQLLPTAAIIGMGLGRSVALVTDGAFPAPPRAPASAFITPEAYLGGPLALVEEGIPSPSTSPPARWTGRARGGAGPAPPGLAAAGEHPAGPRQPAGALPAPGRLSHGGRPAGVGAVRASRPRGPPPSTPGSWGRGQPLRRSPAGTPGV